MKILISMIVLCTTLIGSPQARAEPNCMAHALTDVPAMEAPEEVRSKKNDSFGPITQIKINKRTGRMYFCAQNTYCYDSNAFQIITPCRLKLDKSFLSDLGVNFVYFTR